VRLTLYSDCTLTLQCSICELRSQKLHDPRHVFFKFDRPVHIPLVSAQPFLPILYRSRVGEVPVGAVLNPRDPTAYLKHVLHKETLCDIHSDQIRGIWLRCAHCAAGFDICQDAEQIADHDPTHGKLLLETVERADSQSLSFLKREWTWVFLDSWQIWPRRKASLC